MSGAHVRAAVLGATGLVGRRLVRMLARHPWLELAEVAASPERAGRPYRVASRSAGGGAPSGGAADFRLLAPEEVTAPVVLSALPARAARAVEPALAARGLLVSTNASALRLHAAVPLLVPEVNPEALGLLARQPWAERGGGVVANPNCVVSGLAPVLAALDRAWPIESATVVTLQARSGAGRRGLSDPELADNVVPHIPGEEEKIAAELSKILGRPLPLAVAANRVPVRHGHLAHVFLRLGGDPTPAEAAARLAGCRGPAAGLPSLPARPIRVLEASDAPQPRRDLGHGRGMTVSVGRIRRAADGSLALAVLSHNLVRGAAGACLANAELALALRAATDGHAAASKRERGGAGVGTGRRPPP